MKKAPKYRLSVEVSDQLRSELDRIRESTSKNFTSEAQIAIEALRRQEWLDYPEPIAIVEQDGAVSLNKAAQELEDAKPCGQEEVILACLAFDAETECAQALPKMCSGETP